MDERREQQLLAAAEAVRTWVHAQRATWSDDFPQVFAERRPQTLFEPQAASPNMAPAGMFETMLPTAPSIRFRERAEAVMRWLDALWSRSAPLLQQSWQILQQSWRTAAIAVVLLASAWMVRTYWSDAKALVGTKLASGRRAVESARPSLIEKAGEAAKTGAQQAMAKSVISKSTGRLQVQSDPDGARVLIDGRDRGATPLTIDDLAIGSHKVVLRTPEGSVQRTISITSAQTTQLTEAIFSGWLHVSSPIELQISEGQTAIRLDDSNQVLLAPGSHEVRLENRALGFLEVRRVTVEPGDTTSISVNPKPSPLSLTATEAATVSIDGELVGETPLVDFPVTIGTRDLTVTSASGAVHRQTITVTVQPVHIEVDFSRR